MLRNHVILACLSGMLAVGAGAQATATPAVKAVDVRQAANTPKVDGTIEELWLSADSACGFVQNSPYEDAEPAEPTVVYLLQDQDNLYVAFRCYSFAKPPVASYTKDEDYITLYLDPLGSKTTGYYFTVFGSGLYRDGMILDDGQSDDDTWEGVWYYGKRLYPDRMEVEMRIPFKSIRYKKDRSVWGLQVQRHHARNYEDDYWVPVPQRERNRVSQWGMITGLQPQVKGYYFELFPEGYARDEKYRGEKRRTELKTSLSLKWDLTPQTTLNATVYPDFAQIESDPYSLNLSRYPTYLQEQRPFFVDGSDVFRFSTINESLFQPLNIFYSRMIGRSVDGEAVPIQSGIKLTHKNRDWSMGFLAANTDQFDDSVRIGGYKYQVYEPKRSFFALRTSRRLLGNSQVGILASGNMKSCDSFDIAAGMDAVYRRGGNQFLVQGAMSDKDNKKGWAVSTGYRGFTGPLLSEAYFEAIDDSFDVSEIGFVPWAGRSRAGALTGPFWTFRSGALRSLYLGVGANLAQEPGTDQWSRNGSFVTRINFRNNWGQTIEVAYGRNHGYDPLALTGFSCNYRKATYGLWGNLQGNHFSLYLNYERSYNYQRGFAAYQGMNNIEYFYSIASPLSLGMQGTLWIECDQDNHVIDMYPRLRPSVLWRISPKITLNAFDEMVMLTPGTECSRTTLNSNRVGALFSWNFRPKSWLYVALNDYSGQEPRIDEYSAPADYVMKPQYTISAIKLKYMLYF